MKRIYARILLLLLILIQVLPVTAFAEDEVEVALSAGEQQPYEKMAAQTGNWYSEQYSYGGSAKLVLQYQDEYAAAAFAGPMTFALKENIVLRGIYLPYAAVSEETVVLQLTDEKGNTYPPFTMKAVPLDDTSRKINYVFFPSSDIALDQGSYQLNFVSGGTGAVGAFAVKGVNYEAYQRFKDTLPPLGNENFTGESSEPYTPQSSEEAVEKKPAFFTLEQDCVIDKIILNTYNNGAGAAPGTVSVLAENGTVLLTEQAYGGNLGETANGTWAIAPAVVLPAGNYYIGMSDPSVISYDETGEPLFYVMASEYTPIRHDFTGTYRINFEAVKTSTIMGPVEGGTVDFALQDFELTVLDKDGFIELIGKYQGMPFSQNCRIIEETEESVTAEFSAKADLTKLPYKARIGGDGMVVLTMPDPNNVQIRLEGVGTFQRAASAEKGADDNTYALNSSGTRVSEDLPPFVMTALGKPGNVGNIPGPDSPAQAAAGMLFPPLVGLVASVLQDLMKPKPKPVPVVRDKSWYKKKYPNLSDEQLAMVMLADAMGNTDEPDLEDAEAGDDSGRDSLGRRDTEYGEELSDFEDTEYEPSEDKDYGDDEDDNDAEDFEGADDMTDKLHEPAESEAEFPEEQQPEAQVPREPEEMVLKTSANGAESRYVKDPETGEWVNAETGNVLDYEKYKNEFVKQMEDDKKFNDEQFEKISKGESAHDQAIRDEMQKIADAEKAEAYKNTLKSKYGTDDMDKINEIIQENRRRDEASLKVWQEIADFNDWGDKVATTAGVVADVGVDALATVVPGGKGYKAGYKVLKSIGGAMGEKGVGWDSLAEGGIKGVADAATDYIEIKNPVLNGLAKASVTMTGETAGSAAGAALRGQDWVKAGKEGAIDGVFKVAVGTVTDGIAGDYPKVELPKGASAASAAKVLLNKAAAVKTTSGLVDEFAIKPRVSDLKKELV